MFLTILGMFGLLMLSGHSVSAQSPAFAEGEKLTFQVLFDGYQNAGYAELHVVARGKLDDRDALEIRSRFKTTDFVGAALVKVNENRVTYVDPISGFPVFSRLIEDPDGYSRESTTDFRSGSSSFDLLGLVHALRSQAGRGSIPFIENGTEFSMDFRDGKTERVRTGAGDFDTIITSLESDYFKKLGVWEVRVNFSNDARRLPVQVRLRTKMGKMRIVLASVQGGTPGNFQSVNLTRDPIDSTAAPVGSTISETVPFAAGERTTLRISKAGRAVGDVILQVGQISMAEGKSVVPLTAMFNVAPSEDIPFKSGDSFSNRVDTISLLPLETAARLSAGWSLLSGRFIYNQENGTFTQEDAESGSMASATHDVLSFVYALRAFNLVPGSSPTSPINDTRVSVIMGNRNLIFTVRPNPVETVTIAGRSHRAQMMNIITGESSIDQLSPRIWLGMGKDRPILKISMGDFVAEIL